MSFISFLFMFLYPYAIVFQPGEKYVMGISKISGGYWSKHTCLFLPPSVFFPIFKYTFKEEKKCALK